MFPNRNSPAACDGDRAILASARPHHLRAVEASVLEEIHADPANVGRSLAALRNDLRAAEQDWQDFVRFDANPNGNPWAEHRDEALARHAKLKAEIARRERAA